MMQSERGSESSALEVMTVTAIDPSESAHATLPRLGRHLPHVDRFPSFPSFHPHVHSKAITTPIPRCQREGCLLLL
jgi:hypothetical protein